jgi:outer membrane protein OmpA-like peptidoglycan-associated protein
MVRAIALGTLALFAASCASTPDPKVCAAVGAALGGGGGAYAGRETPGHDGDEIIGYGAAGIVVGGAAGWALCKVLAKEEPKPEPRPEPAPPPPPPAREPSEPAPPPPPDPCDQTIRLRGVNFDFDKSAIRPDAAVILDEAANQLGDALRECPSRSVVIEGHTDAIGTDAYNQALSMRRAQSVYDYLVEHGVPASELSKKGYGESRPVATNETPQGRAMNRRVELNLVQ